LKKLNKIKIITSIVKHKKEFNNITNKNLIILIVSSHPPIDYELTLEWVKLGHKVYLTTKASKWHDQFHPLDASVNRGIPEEQPNLIIVEHPLDTFFAVFLKIKKMWIGSKLVVIHLWYPRRNPALYLYRNISVCEYERKYLKKIQGISSDVAYCPVDTIFFKNETIKIESPTVLVIGNGFKSRKMMGYDHLLSIIDKIHSKRPDFHIVVMGNNNGEDFPEYVSIVNGNKSEMKEQINKSSAVFFTTTHNLIMNSMQIAMACERKVIAFDLEPFHEVIEDRKSGYMVPDFDDELFANTVIEAVVTQDNEMGKLAREVIVEKCESLKVASQIITLGIEKHL